MQQKTIKLHHIHRQTKSGINVFVLDKGSVIDSEAEAMLQALHSRSTGGFLEHLDILEKKGAEKFMSTFYVGYGHKSIGDCGSITIFIEGVSMLGAKAIQDTKLYNGQEASTRYIDFSQQPIIDPIGTTESKDLLEKQRSFYLAILHDLKSYISSLYPMKEGENEKVYQKTVNAKAFDISRGFLPAGFSTNLAWHTTLRQVADRILVLRDHPLKEVREVGEILLDAVLEKYPNSFSKKTYEGTQKYVQDCSAHYYYHNPTIAESVTIIQDTIDSQKLKDTKELFNTRPNGKTELPTYLDMIGTIDFTYQIDFGSFRDVQRHRAPYQRMPLLTTDIGFNNRYMESLSIQAQSKASQHLKEIEAQLKKLQCTVEEKQYFVPMGFNTSCEMMGTLPALIYMAELRSTTYVHETLRTIAIQLGDYIEKTHKIKLFIDRSSNPFDTRRGTHDIEIK